MLILVSVISICLALEHFCLHGSKTKAVRVLPQCEWVLTMTKVHMMHQHPPFFHPKCNRENRRGLEIFNQVSLYFKWINCNKSAICRPICILFWHTKTKWPHTASKNALVNTTQPLLPLSWKIMTYSRPGVALRIQNTPELCWMTVLFLNVFLSWGHIDLHSKCL